jgi:ATP-dependent Clp protease ATP-binding subunit ClpA
MSLVDINLISYLGNSSSLEIYDEYQDYDYDDEEKGPALEIYGTDLTLLARQGQLEECFGRDQ